MVVVFWESVLVVLIFDMFLIALSACCMCHNKTRELAVRSPRPCSTVVNPVKKRVTRILADRLTPSYHAILVSQGNIPVLEVLWT